MLALCSRSALTANVQVLQDECSSLLNLQQQRDLTKIQAAKRFCSCEASSAAGDSARMLRGQAAATAGPRGGGSKQHHGRLTPSDRKILSR